MADMHPAERFFSAQHPINAYLKVRFVGVDETTLSVELEAPEAFVVDPSTREVHSGLATLVLDTVMGGAAMGTMKVIRPIATTGLTVQHLRRAKAGEALVCKAVKVGEHSQIAHMTGELRSRENGDILTTATGTFMLGTRARPLGARL